MTLFRNFPGGSVARTLCPQCRGPGSVPGWGTGSHTLQLRKTKWKGYCSDQLCLCAGSSLCPPDGLSKLSLPTLCCRRLTCMNYTKDSPTPGLGSVNGDVGRRWERDGGKVRVVTHPALSFWAVLAKAAILQSSEDFHGDSQAVMLVTKCFRPRQDKQPCC